MTSRLAYAYSLIGHRDEALRLLNELEGLSDKVSRVGHLALAHLAAGNYEESQGWYDEFIENSDRPNGGTSLWPHIKADGFLALFSNDYELVEMRSRPEFIE
jgi:hypothetical protein